MVRPITWNDVSSAGPPPLLLPEAERRFHPWRSGLSWTVAGVPQRASRVVRAETSEPSEVMIQDGPFFAVRLEDGWAYYRDVEPCREDENLIHVELVRTEALPDA